MNNKNINFIESNLVLAAINKYPIDIQVKLHNLRSLILEVASEISSLTKIEESLKWGQPSFITKHGSSLRIDGDKSCPSQYFILFHCQTKLVDTFKERYKNIFKYNGNRAIVFNVAEDIPVEEVKCCIKLALTYHSIKHLPMLGL